MPIAKFLKSAVLPSDYPDPAVPEIALVGRSNSGKSTLLNAICGQPVAKVSGTPGKTRLINFFQVGEHYRLVDLPGYGYAVRNDDERKMWSQMIHDFFATRENLKGFLLICDMRREWTGDEQLIFDLSQSRGLNILCILTKLDKLGQNESRKLFQNWLKTSRLSPDFFRPVSSMENDGIKEMEKFIFQSWIKPLIDEKGAC